MESRNSSAPAKRAEQIRRWEDSETNLEPPYKKSNVQCIQFHDGTIFLAACSSGDKDEVIRLLDRKADINTTNIDGLTALHQVSFFMCIISRGHPRKGLQVLN